MADQELSAGVAGGTATAPAALDIREITKSYRTRDGGDAAALGPVSLTVADGEFVSIVGPSGCGKTTMMKICAGLVPATGGTVDFAGTGGPVPSGRYGIVLQTPALLPWRTVLHNVMLPADILGRPASKEERRSRAEDMLRLVNLEGQGPRYPQELSGGMQQRVAIARALFVRPDVLFMDEPFGALDAITRQELNLRLQYIHLEERTTVVFVTHSIQEAVLLSDRVLVLSDRPGTVADDVRIDLPRPRSLAEVGASAAARELEDHISGRLAP